MDKDFYNGELISSLHWAISATKNSTTALPIFLRAVLEKESWQGSRHDPMLEGILPGSLTLEEFIREPPLIGLGTTVEFLDRFCDGETRKMLHDKLNGKMTTHDPVAVKDQLSTLANLFSMLPIEQKSKFLTWAEVEKLRNPAEPSFSSALHKVSAPPRKEQGKTEISVNVSNADTAEHIRTVFTTHRSKINHDNAQSIVDDYLSGMTCKKISTAHGISSSATNQFLKELGIMRPKGRRSK